MTTAIFAHLTTGHPLVINAAKTLPPDIIPIGLVRADKNHKTGQRAVLAITTAGHFVRVTPTKVIRQLPRRETTQAIIRHLIEIAGSQAAFCDRTGFPLDTVKKWSAGSRTPTYGTVRTLLMAFSLIK